MSDDKFGYPTKCWNCSMPLPVFTFSCGICGTDNTPYSGKAGDAGKDKPSTRQVLKEEIERRRRDFRKSLKGE